MKHLKKFEGRKPAYKFLSKENAEKIEQVAREFIKDHDIPGRIDKLKFNDFSSQNFDYREIFDRLLSTGDNKYGNGLYGHGNIYYVVDVFKQHTNMLDGATPELRNSLHDIISKLYIEYDIKTLLDEKLIELLQKDSDKYRKRLEQYEDVLNKKVKNSCRWMLDAEKYNI